MGNKRTLAATKLWADHIAAWQRSGQTVEQYCMKHDLAKGSFYRWKIRFGATPPATTPNGKVKKSSVAQLIPVSVFSEASQQVALPGQVFVSSGVRLELTNGHRIDLSSDFDVPTFRRLLDALEAA